MPWSFKRITVTSTLARGGGHQLERAKVIGAPSATRFPC
jgi:hypothetical protein